MRSLSCYDPALPCEPSFHLRKRTRKKRNAFLPYTLRVLSLGQSIYCVLLMLLQSTFDNQYFICLSNFEKLASRKGRVSASATVVQSAGPTFVRCQPFKPTYAFNEPNQFIEMLPLLPSLHSIHVVHSLWNFSWHGST